MSKNTPNDILLDIFCNLDRNEIEKCQLICQKWNSSVNKNSLSLRKIYSMYIGKKCSCDYEAQEIFVFLTLYDKETDEYSEIKLIDESNEKDRDKDEQKCYCLNTMQFFPNQKPINRTYGYTFDIARIKSLKYCMLETIEDERWPEKCVIQKILDKLIEIIGSKLNVIRYVYQGHSEIMPLLASSYLNVYKFKCTVEYPYGIEDEDEDDEYKLDKFPTFHDKFFTMPPMIPTPPLRISVDFPYFSYNDLNIIAIKNLKLHGPSHYSLSFPTFHVDDEFFIQLLKYYQNANPEELSKTVKFVNDPMMMNRSYYDKKMSSAYYNFMDFLNKQGYKKESTCMKSYLCKHCNAKAKSYFHWKDTYEIRKTDTYVIQIQNFRLRINGCNIIPDPEFTCRLKYRVQLL